MYSQPLNRSIIQPNLNSMLKLPTESPSDHLSEETLVNISDLLRLSILRVLNMRHSLPHWRLRPSLRDNLHNLNDFPTLARFLANMRVALRASYVCGFGQQDSLVGFEVEGLNGCEFWVVVRRFKSGGGVVDLLVGVGDGRRGEFGWTVDIHCNVVAHG